MSRKARVTFASIAINKPHVLLFDEPTNHLDIESIDALIAAINENSGFNAKHHNFGTLPGDDEGVFGWLSANFLLSTDKARADHPKFGTVGALDLGGGSTQITMPATAGAPNTVAVPLPQSASSVFTHSHLGFGNKQVSGARGPPTRHPHPDPH